LWHVQLRQLWGILRLDKKPGNYYSLAIEMARNDKGPEGPVGL